MILIYGWEKYGLNGEYTGISAAQLTVVRHVVHYSEALRIVEDGKIFATLVRDESILNDKRQCVTWMSANNWSYNGSIYGTIELMFDWEKIIKGKTFYWVEDIADYNPPAFRFLITEKQEDEVYGLKKYDPKKENGPLVFDNGKWYWNGNYTSEFMIDSDFLLSDCLGFQGIDHHPKHCRRKAHIPYNCSEQEWKADQSAMRLTAYLMARNEEVIGTEGSCTSGYSTGVTYLTHYLGGNEYSGKISAPEKCEHIVRCALASIALGQSKAARQIVSQISKEGYALDALEKLLKKHLLNTKGYDDVVESINEYREFDL